MPWNRVHLAFPTSENTPQMDTLPSHAPQHNCGTPIQAAFPCSALLLNLTVSSSRIPHSLSLLSTWTWPGPWSTEALFSLPPVPSLVPSHDCCLTS